MAAVKDVPRGPFVCPPGLDLPPGLIIADRASNETRIGKRNLVLNGFKRETAYITMSFLREHAALFKTPEEKEPSTPKPLPHLSKREFEKELRAFKETCKRWTAFVTEGKAVSRTDSSFTPRAGTSTKEKPED